MSKHRDDLAFSNENSVLASAITRYLARRRRNRIAKRKKALRGRRSRKSALLQP
ncbi:MAG: hypothetical protein WD397_17450 [Wenzhouxiangellaceae bacterium]